MQYIRQNIFDPLEMARTAFIPTAEMDERFALPYVFDEEKGKHVPLSRVRVAIWATGQVYGTAGNLGNWLIANLNGGTFKGNRILGAETLAQAHKVQFDDLRQKEPDGGSTGYGLGWNVTEREEERFISHSGSLPGETAFVLANVTRKSGVAILSNGNRAHTHLSRLAYGILKILSPAGSGPMETKP
jgi:CubicO group peptidase (beta-lactamase class C family)